MIGRFPVKLAVLFAVFSIICGFFIYTVPGPVFAVADYLLHSTIQFTVKPFDLGSIVISAGLWALIGLITGLVFPKLWEWCNR